MSAEDRGSPQETVEKALLGHRVEYGARGRICSCGHSIRPTPADVERGTTQQEHHARHVAAEIMAALPLSVEAERGEARRAALDDAEQAIEAQIEEKKSTMWQTERPGLSLAAYIVRDLRGDETQTRATSGGWER